MAQGDVADEAASMMWRLVLTLVLVALQTGCAASHDLPPQLILSPLDEIAQGGPPLKTALYTLGAADVLGITVYGYPDLSLDVTISAQEDFVFPRLGMVKAAGLTVTELERELTRRLQAVEVVHPQVAIRVKAYGKAHVFVLGEVRTPGVYALKHNASLLELLVQANGITRDAGWHVLVIWAERKRVKGQVVAVKHMESFPGVRIELEKLLAGERLPPVRIRSGDTVYVPRRTHYYACIGGPAAPWS